MRGARRELRRHLSLVAAHSLAGLLVARLYVNIGTSWRGRYYELLLLLCSFVEYRLCIIVVRLVYNFIGP